MARADHSCTLLLDTTEFAERLKNGRARALAPKYLIGSAGIVLVTS